MGGSVASEHDFSAELRDVLAKSDVHPLAKDRLSRKAYDLETKCAALLLRAQGAEKRVAWLEEGIRIKTERIAELEAQLAEAERMNDAIARATQED